VGEFAPVNLRTVIEDVILLTQPCWKDQAQARGANIRVETHFDSVPEITGAKSELREMAMNLMLNAIDAIEAHGVIRVSLFEDRERVCLRIRDNGIGMSAEVAERCMEPFFTAKPGVGSGLGLGVVHGIAQRHKARVNIQSLVGEGTEVTIRFPACQPRDGRDTPLPPVYGLRILAAEDEPMIREILGVYLSEDAHLVEMAVDGTQALQKLQEGTFDLVITDHSMPGVSGDKVAEAARNRDGNLRVLMLTGFGDMLTQRGMPPLAVDALIPKPFTFESLRRGISKAMAQGNRSPA
jgi:CheY-like chemotaxis protein